MHSEHPPIFRNSWQRMTGKKIFTGITTIDNIHVDGTVNNKNMTSFFHEVVLSNENHRVEHATFENGVDTHADLHINGNLTVLGFVNGVNLTAFDEEVMKTVGEQRITSKSIEGVVSVNEVNTTGWVNGLNISEDLVTKETSQKIRG